MLGKSNSEAAAPQDPQQLLRHLGIITELADDGIIIMDLTGVLHFVNSAWARMHGYRTSRELLGKKIGFFHSKTQLENQLNPSLKEVQQNGQFTGQIYHVRRDGTTFSTVMKMKLLTNEQGTAAGLVAIARPVTTDSTTAEPSQQIADQTVETEQLDLEMPEHKEVQEQLEEKVADLTSTNEQLQEEIASPGDAEEQLRRQTTDLTALSEERQDEIGGLKQSEDELQGYVDRLEGQLGELTSLAEEDKPEVIPDEEPNDDELDDGKPVPAPFNDEKLKAIADLAKKLR